MMRLDRKNIIIGLAALLGIQIILVLFLNFFSSQNIKSRYFEKELVKKFNKDAVISFEISDYQDTFSIDKKEDNWFIKVKENDLPGDITKIKSYLDILQNLTRGVIVDKGHDISNETHFGFDQKSYQKIHVKTTNKKDFILYLGKTGSKRGTSYIRLNDEKKVREVKSFIASETSNQPIKWAKRNIFDNIAQEDVEKCEINSSMEWFKGGYTIKYKDQEDDKKEDFVLDPPIENKELKQYVLQNIIKNFLNLTIDDYKLNRDVYQKKSMASIKLILKNNKSFMLDLYRADEDDIGDYIIDVDFNDYLYLVNEGDVKRFIKAKIDLVKKK
ncbi:MAG: DUF4340 domain-containing protein [Spirochaetes bacterium]|nr:DUF4340 domain-containing protein [Spirochaetota bacterium]